MQREKKMRVLLSLGKSAEAPQQRKDARIAQTIQSLKAKGLGSLFGVCLQVLDPYHGLGHPPGYWLTFHALEALGVSHGTVTSFGEAVHREAAMHWAKSRGLGWREEGADVVFATSEHAARVRGAGAVALELCGLLERDSQALLYRMTRCYRTVEVFKSPLQPAHTDRVLILASGLGEDTEAHDRVPMQWSLYLAGIDGELVRRQEARLTKAIELCNMVCAQSPLIRQPQVDQIRCTCLRDPNLRKFTKQFSERELSASALAAGGLGGWLLGSELPDQQTALDKLGDGPSALLDPRA
jgi:hypothetical protein